MVNMLSCLRRRRPGVPVEALENYTTIPSSVSDHLHVAAPLWASVRKGEVALISCRWLLTRAGYAESTRKGVSIWTLQAGYAAAMPPPLPNRQSLEADHPEAIVHVEVLEAYYAASTALLDRAVNRYDGRTARADGLDAVPIVSLSYCWEDPDHPDPCGRTLSAVAARLATLLPLLNRWGLEDCGFFWDWSSLYQSKPTPRTSAQQASFDAAIVNMSMWYAHRLVTVIALNTQVSSAAFGSKASAARAPLRDRKERDTEERYCREFHT